MGDRYYNLAVDEYQSGYKDPVKIVIVTSPVADYYALSDMQALLGRSGTGVKAVGVIESSIKEALKGVDEEGNFCVGVLYSPEGVTSREYETAIRRMASESGVTGRIQVFNQEGLGIEEALAGNPAYVDTSARVSRSGYAGPVTGISYNNIDASLFDRYGFDTRGNALLFPAGGRNISGVQLNSVENYVRYHLVSMVERHRRSGSRIPISSIILADCGYDRLRGFMDQVMVELYNYRRGGIYLYRGSISPRLPLHRPRGVRGERGLPYPPGGRQPGAARDEVHTLSLHHPAFLLGAGRLAGCLRIFPGEFPLWPRKRD